jgi:hypothetical protein
MQPNWPISGWYVPDGHVSHRVANAADWYVPAA